MRYQKKKKKRKKKKRKEKEIPNAKKWERRDINIHLAKIPKPNSQLIFFLNIPSDSTIIPEIQKRYDAAFLCGRSSSTVYLIMHLILTVISK
jgi:hypothetical protein